MTGPFLYFPHDRLSPAELSAARLDGHVVELGEGYIPADAVETAEMRAASLSVLCDERFAACLWSAAWVYGALATAPARHSLVRAVEHRVGNLIGRRAIFHDWPVRADQVIRLGGVLVVRRDKTMADLARRLAHPVDAVRARAAVEAMAEAFGVAEGIRWMRDQQRLPGRADAVAELLRIGERYGQDDVTR
ncbi:hypothetical protein ACIGCK_07720 [Microbacterium sp. NPDC078428]|uniref:hypothetical protein n=1 Tax=Microbacterium sp. NPDC078428 TaxID=3364190 RepID=UPI0037CA9336